MSCETGAKELADKQIIIYHVLFTKTKFGYNNKYILVTPVWNILEVLITYTSK